MLVLCKLKDMPVNNITAQAAKYIQKPTNMRKVVTHLNKAGVLLPVILLEATVTGGRTYQAYKRGGATEARERLCEESVGAVFWLWGVKFFNEIGNWIGKKYLNIENPAFSLAKDAVRHPFENMVRDKNLDAVKKKLVAFKFTKIALSVLMAGGTLGFVVPKINQAVTRKMLKNDEKKQQNQANVNKSIQGSPVVQAESMDKFVERTSNNQNPTFKGLSIDKFATITNNLENHDIYKLLSTDVGVLAGRTYNARNKDERIEILFRDGASVYFYLFCKDHVIKLMQKMDGFGGKLSKLDPTTAMATHNALIMEMIKHKNNPEYKTDIETVRKYVYGSNPENVDKILSKISFAKGDIIAFEDFERLARAAGADVDEKMIKKARIMSKFQPARELTDIGKPAGKAMYLLTRQQVRDVLDDSIISSPKFLREVLRQSFDGALRDKYNFVPRGTVETLRQNIDDYVKAILEYAQKNNVKEITPELLVQLNKKNFWKNALHIGSGLGVSALFLSTIIPKVQYWITEKRTGSKEFPGVKDINK